MAFVLFVLKNVLFVFAVVAFLSTAHGLLDEHGCNRFQFQEKLLEKMVVLDHSMKVTLSDLETKLTRYENENLKLKNNLENLQDKLKTDAKKSTETMTKDLINIRTEFRQQTTHMQLQQQQQLSTGFADMWKNLTGEMNQLEEQSQKTSAGDFGTPVKKPVAFNAYMSGSDIDPSVGSAIVFNQVVQNNQNAYSTSDGKFTPPIAGVYHFSVQICMSEKDRVGIQLLSSARIYAAASYREEYDATCYSVSTVAVLAQGEKVWVKCVKSDDNNSSPAIEADTTSEYRTTFNGHLVHTIA